MTQLLSLEDAKALRDAMTPGPWGSFATSAAPDAPYRHQIAALGKTVAYLYETKGGEADDQANARAIASLPDLLTSYITVLEENERLRANNRRRLLRGARCPSCKCGHCRAARTTLKETSNVG